MKVSSVADALASVPDCSSTLAKLSFGQCLTRLQPGLKAVRESSLTAAEEVDVFTPLWWIADHAKARAAGVQAKEAGDWEHLAHRVQADLAGCNASGTTSMSSS